jgi:hypothetical protein
MSKITRFDVEQQMMNCFTVVDELKLLGESLVEKRIGQDKLTNLIIGLSELYQLKFEKLLESFESCVKSGDIK